MAKRKSAGEPAKNALPARRSSRKSNVQPGKENQRQDVKKAEVAVAVAPTKKARTSSTLTYPTLLDFDETEAIQAQVIHSDFFSSV